jgi:ABC-type Fe3+-siderophore transport system permease subunit
MDDVHSNSKGFLTVGRAAITLGVLAVLVLVLAVIALALGSEPISLADVLRGSLTLEQEAIIYGLRLPRIGLALCVGGALAVSGASFQSLLRNPLADPYILGVSGGAAVGSLLGIMLASEIPLARPLLSFAGAAAASSIVYRLGKRDPDPARLVLAGVIISTFLSSLIALITSLADDIRLRNITLWLLGDLSSGSLQGLFFVFVALLTGVVVVVTQSRALNLMMVGERDAFALGVETARVRWIVYGAASLLTGAAVSAGGAIGYVGLVVPHLVRLAAGSDNRLVIPAAALGGALLVLLADTIARVALAPRELPTGAITALVGAPLFMWLLLKRR